MDQDDEGGFDFFSFLDGVVDDDNRDRSSEEKEDDPLSCPLNSLTDLEMMVRELRRQQTDDLSLLERLIQNQMGTMALCRGQRGELLREAGAIEAVLDVLSSLTSLLPIIGERNHPASEENTLRLAIVAWGAIRDLACGNAPNRKAVRQFRSSSKNESKGTSGNELQALHLQKYHKVSWQVMSTTEIRYVTTVIGVMRNVTHSTPENCLELHRCRVSEMLIWRLLYGGSDESAATELPHASSPWREAAFRTAGTLINMAEKCRECATLYGSNTALVHLLVESSGGNASSKTAPLLHLGLAAIVEAAKNQLPPQEYKWEYVLVREQERKASARRREEERKRLAVQNKTAK